MPHKAFPVWFECLLSALKTDSSCVGFYVSENNFTLSCPLYLSLLWSLLRLDRGLWCLNVFTSGAFYCNLWAECSFRHISKWQKCKHKADPEKVWIRCIFIFCDKAMFVQTISDFILKKEKKICNTVYDHCSIFKCGNVFCHIIPVSLPSCGTLQVFFILSPKRKRLEQRIGVILSESDFESDTPGHFLCQCLTWASKKKNQNFNYFPCPWQKF